LRARVLVVQFQRERRRQVEVGAYTFNRGYGDGSNLGNDLT
jgi:hypothetical protein